MLEKHRPGRRVRGDAELGSERIIIGMRSAIRHLRTSRLSRKDIAEFAGVTPPLVSYYFSDREALVEAATLPIVRSFAEDMNRCLSQGAPPEQVLWETIELILTFRARDGAIIDAYAKFRQDSASQKSNPLVTIEGMLKSFFEGWLKDSRNGRHYASLCGASLVALCKYISDRSDISSKHYSHVIYEIIVCIVGGSDAPNPSLDIQVDDVIRASIDGASPCLIRM